MRLASLPRSILYLLCSFLQNESSYWKVIRGIAFYVGSISAIKKPTQTHHSSQTLRAHSPSLESWNGEAKTIGSIN